MSLAATLRSAVDTAFGALGDLAEPVTYIQVTGGTYNLTTRITTPTTSETPASAIFTQYTTQERADTAIRPEDRRAIVQASVLSVRPSVDDMLRRAGGDVWTVVDVTMLGTLDDPATAAAWELRVRRPS